MDDFEDDLKIALTRLKRAELKESLQAQEKATFEAETTKAFKNIEKKRLKTQLVEHAAFISNKQTVALKAKSQILANGSETTNYRIETTKVSFFRYWKYAVAACVVFGLSFYFIYQTNQNESTLAESTPIKIDSILKTKIEDININNKDSIKSSPQIENANFVKFAISIKTENLGFGIADKLKCKIIIDKTAKGIYYLLEKQELILRSSKDIKVHSVINYQDNMYININSFYYLISPNTTSNPIIAINDEELIKNLNKIDLTK